MRFIIYISLLFLVVISGLYSISPFENKEKPKEEKTAIELMGLRNTVDAQMYLSSKKTALVVFILSLIALMAMYFIKI